MLESYKTMRLLQEIKRTDVITEIFIYISQSLKEEVLH